MAPRDGNLQQGQKSKAVPYAGMYYGDYLSKLPSATEREVLDRVHIAIASKFTNIIPKAMRNKQSYMELPVSSGPAAMKALEELATERDIEYEHIEDVFKHLKSGEYFERVIKNSKKDADDIVGKIHKVSGFETSPIFHPIVFEVIIKDFFNNHEALKDFDQNAFNGLWTEFYNLTWDGLFPDDDASNSGKDGVIKQVFLSPEWQTSNGCNKGVMEAVCINAGLRERSADIDIYEVARAGNAVKLAPVNIQDLAERIAESMELRRKKGIDTEVQATNLMRIFTLHNMVQDGRLDLANAHPDFANYDAGSMEKLKQTLMPVLLKEYESLGLKDIDPEFISSAGVSAQGNTPSGDKPRPE